MARTTKNGLGLILVLSVLTFGLHACYRTNAQLVGTADQTAPAAPPPPPSLPPWKQPAASVAVAVAPDSTGATRGAVSLSALTDRTAVLRGGDGIVNVEVTIDTNAASSTAPTPSDIVVIVDRSGSMAGEKLEYARRALRGLIARLEPEDRFGLVEYSDRASVRIPLAHVTEGARASFLRSVGELGVAGGTNMSDGLDLGVEQMTLQREANRSARVLLLSDGLANVGDSTLPGLMRRAQRAVRGEFVLSTMGIGADFDERVMTSLAKAGTGAFYYLAKLETLPDFLDAELKTANETFASAVQLRFQPAPGVSVLGAAGDLVEHTADGVVVPLGGLYTGQKRKVWLTLRVPAFDLRDHELGRIGLAYRHDGKPYEIAAAPLPSVASVIDPSEFRARIVQPVWERATIEAEVSAAQERLAVAIGSGNTQDVDSALSAVPERRRLAQELGNQRVLAELTDLERRGVEAKRAQAAPASERNIAAKRQSAEGFSRSRPSAYKNIEADHGY